jgi:lipooligosaccharide transport system permease protein
LSNYSLPLRPLEFFFAQYRRVWRGTIVTSIVTPVVFLLAFGWGLGQVANDSLGLPEGVSYLEYVAPGLLAATAMQLASFEAAWPVLSAIKWNRQYHAMIASPLRIGDVVLGHQAFIASRMATTAAVYLIVITAFGAVESPLGVLTIPVAVLVGLSFSSVLAAWAAYAENEASFVAIFRFVILPMFLFSGTFFSIESLPRLFEAIAYLTPLWHGVDLSRQLTLGEVDPTSAVLHVAYLVAFISAGLVAAHFTYRRRLLK